MSTLKCIGKISGSVGNNNEEDNTHLYCRHDGIPVAFSCIANKYIDVSEKEDRMGAKRYVFSKKVIVVSYRQRKQSHQKSCASPSEF